MCVAGDPSGDLHASRVLRCLRSSRPGIDVFGIGGPHMQGQGLNALLPFGEFNRMGFAEVLAHLPFFLRAKSLLVARMRERRPGVLLCVDYPGLNIPLMKAARRLGIAVVWYIVPQVWAGKRRRAEVLGRNASLIAAVFPFEVELFGQYPAPVAFVGHPLVESLAEKGIVADPRRRVEQVRRRRPRVAVLPGSREQEVAHLLGPMLDACGRLRAEYPDMTVRVSRLPHIHSSHYESGATAATGVEWFAGPLDELLAESDLAFVTSGTATLQTALAGVLPVIAYKTSPLTSGILRRLVKVPWIGLPNIVAGEKIVPECIQGGVTGEALAEAMLPFLRSERLFLNSLERLARLREKLGTSKPSETVAAGIGGMLDSGGDGRGEFRGRGGEGVHQ